MLLIFVALIIAILLGVIYYYTINNSQSNTYSAKQSITTNTPDIQVMPESINMSEVGCEAAPPILRCPAGKLIKSGTIRYGRWDNNTCPHETIKPDTPEHYQIYDITSSAIGLNEYSYPAINTIHGDPYPNIYKQFSVNYTCG